MMGMEPGRNRRARMALLDAGRSMDRAFSVRELHAAARRTEPKLGLTTAYRTVERWREEGWAEEAGSRGGEAVYVLCAAQGHHHHVVCVDCGATALLEGCALEPARDSARSAGFDLLDAALAALPARCSSCAESDGDGR
jgi:Fur family transcriptional regulator, ferric uptake regulator